MTQLPSLFLASATTTRAAFLIGPNQLLVNCLQSKTTLMCGERFKNLVSPLGVQTTSQLVRIQQMSAGVPHAMSLQILGWIHPVTSPVAFRAVAHHKFVVQAHAVQVAAQVAICRLRLLLDLFCSLCFLVQSSGAQRRSCSLSLQSSD
jgi:hypothetical protein